MSASVFDERICGLGEGPLWHPERNRLFWFDITGMRLLSREGDRPLVWQFEEHVSAAGWIDMDNLLIASGTALFRFNLISGIREDIMPLEADDPVTRSNDGRADPYGGFWIGTMGKKLEKNKGAIYRFFKGELRKLYHGISVSNAICFSPDKKYAYFSDTPLHQIMRQELDQKGWPKGKPEIFIDLSKEKLNPDGAVVDSKGCLWNAQWGASRIARYSPQGEFLSEFGFPALQVSCPAFWGKNLSTLLATSATYALSSPGPHDGKTFQLDTGFKGQSEHRVIL